MARSCGIRLGPRRFELVVLDGSAKKFKIVKSITGELPDREEDPSAAVDVLRKAVKQSKVPAENTVLVADSGQAAFRSMTLPFEERSKIEQVIKYEVESRLPQWNIDDVIVDFLVLSSTGVESSLLITALPKDSLRDELELCERAGVDPQDAELESTAMVTAAECAGILKEGEAHLLIHVGDLSTAVVVTDGERVHSMRALHIGAASAAGGLQALFPSASDAEGEDAAEEASQDKPSGPTVAEVRARILRELGRTIAGAQLETPIQGIHVCGQEIPGLIGERVNDVPIQALALDVIGAEECLVSAAALGGALGRLGGGSLNPSLRREELRFAGKLERLELPLAVLGLFLVTALAVQLIVTQKQILWRGEGSPEHKGDMQIWVEAVNNYMLGQNLKNAPEGIRKFAKDAEAGRVEDLTKFEQLQEVEFRLGREIARLQKELGQDGEIKQPASALEGLTLVLSILSKLEQEDRIDRFALRAINATYERGKSDRPDRITVKLDMTFFGTDDVVATRDYSTFLNTLDQEPWCMEYERKTTSPLVTGNGISIDALTVVVDPAKNVKSGRQVAEDQEAPK